MPDVYYSPHAWGEDTAEQLNRMSAAQVPQEYAEFIARHAAESYHHIYDPPTPKECVKHIWSPNSVKCMNCEKTLIEQGATL